MRLQQAAENRPPIRWMERGDAVAILQQALIDLGFNLPQSTRTGQPDAIFGAETLAAVKRFQSKYGLQPDGVVGRKTMAQFDLLLPAAPPPSGFSAYTVPGTKTVVRQPSPMSCWATVYSMMRSWKDQTSYPIRDAVLRVGPRWAAFYDSSYPPSNQGLPSKEFGPFLRDAGMTHQPMANITILEWGRLLRRYGLLWIGASVTVNPNTGLHSRILQGISGDGTSASTSMHIIDPANGNTYLEAFPIFLAKYESGILSVSGEYFQIRHFQGF